MHLKRYFILFLGVLFVFIGKAQNAEIQSLNNFVNFSNECTHGMLIVHRLLENFNQEVNKFVDLESHQINFYSNKDLPKDIFQDDENWFYDTSPNEWFEICKNTTSSGANLAPLMQSARKMKSHIGAINQLRFTAENYLKSNDLNEREHQEKIYEILEEGVALFENFYLEQEVLRKNLESYVSSRGIAPNTDAIRSIHQKVRALMEDLRYKNDNDWANDLQVLKDQLKQSNFSGETRRKLTSFLEASTRFIETAEVSEEYKLYGKYYYYHNSQLLNFANRYGNGYVSSYNMKLEDDAALKMMEIPHFYKVIYPSKLLEDVPLASTDPLIVDIPDKLKDRLITINDRKIQVESEVLSLEIFDHKMIDGDIVSVNFNGDWILEEHQLKGKPYILDVKLNKEGKNYLLLHAVNLGKQPPNTMALRYSYKGKKETVVLSSDLNESELIEIELK